MKNIYIIIILIGFLFISIGCSREKEQEVLNIEREESSTRIAMTHEDKTSFVEGEVLLKFKSDISKILREEIIKEYDCRILNVIESIQVYRVRIPEGKSVPDMIKILNSDDRVKYAEPNMIYKIQE